MAFFFFFLQRPDCCVLESQTTRNLDTCVCRPDLWERGDAEPSPEARGAVEREGFREGNPQCLLAMPELCRPARVGLLSVPVWPNEIRMGLMSRAVGDYNWLSNFWLKHGCHVSFWGGADKCLFTSKRALEENQRNGPPLCPA